MHWSNKSDKKDPFKELIDALFYFPWLNFGLVVIGFDMMKVTSFINSKLKLQGAEVFLFVIHVRLGTVVPMHSLKGIIHSFLATHTINSVTTVYLWKLLHSTWITSLGPPLHSCIVQKEDRLYHQVLWWKGEPQTTARLPPVCVLCVSSYVLGSLETSLTSSVNMNSWLLWTMCSM